jgi:hypothetical protein
VDKRFGRAPTDDDNTITTAREKKSLHDYYRILRWKKEENKKRAPIGVITADLNDAPHSDANEKFPMCYVEFFGSVRITAIKPSSGQNRHRKDSQPTALRHYCSAPIRIAVSNKGSCELMGFCTAELKLKTHFAEVWNIFFVAACHL